MQESLAEINNKITGCPCTFTLVIVNKRISQRFFEGIDNPPSGTLVDSVVVESSDAASYDFYLVSQEVTQGSVLPTHFHVFHDEAKFKPDCLKQFTYDLCHLYYNWAGPVKVPAPVQYAHKMAIHTDNLGDWGKCFEKSNLNSNLHFI